MERRIFGIENEYGVTCTTQGQRRLTPDEVARYLGDRLTRLTDDADRTLPELRIELPPCLWHTYSS